MRKVSILLPLFLSSPIRWPQSMHLMPSEPHQYESNGYVTGGLASPLLVDSARFPNCVCVCVCVCVCERERERLSH